jgi:hypothetical protein
MRHRWEMRTSVAALGPPPVGDVRSHFAEVRCEVSDKRREFHVKYESQAIPAIDRMTCGTCEESCCQPNNLRYVVSEFAASCGEQ